MKHLILFTAAWYNPCKGFKPIFYEAEKEYPSVNFLEMDVEERMDQTRKFKIDVVPTLVLLEDGVEIKKIKAPSTMANIREALDV